MTILELYNKHKQGLVTKEKFLYEMRKDAQLPWINNLTSYSDAIQILKNKGIIVKSTSVNEGAFDDFKITHVDDPSYIEDPYGDEEYEDDEEDDEDDDFGFDSARDNGHLEDVSEAEDKKVLDMIKKIKLRTMDAIKQINNDKSLSNEKRIEMITQCGDIQEKAIKQVKAIAHSNKKYENDNPISVARRSPKKQEGLNEQKDLNLEIDRLNPIIVAKAINSEIVQLPGQEANKETYSKIQKKVVNKLKKNPRAYDYLFITNSTEIEKADKTLEMQPVKKDNLKDKPNEMVKVKLKETILKMLKEEHEIDYAPNNIVRLPEGGEGTIVEVKGGTLTIEMKDKTKKHYQMNVIKHANRPEAMEEESTETKEEEPKDELMEKIKKYLRALKDKKKRKVDEDETIAVTTTNQKEVRNRISKDPSLTSTQRTALSTSAIPGSVLKK